MPNRIDHRKIAVRKLGRKPVQVLSVLALFACLTQAAHADVAGYVEVVAGTVNARDAHGQPRPLATGAAVMEGDTIVTGTDGELQLRMEDNGYLAIRPATELVIASYRARGDAQDGAVLRLVKGTLRSITGWIGTHNRDRYSVQTPVATLGIRGTDHEPLYIPDPSGDADAGTYDKVNDGATFIKNAAGTVEIGAGQAGFAPRVGHPQLLHRLPTLYRATANEHVIERIKPLLARERDARRNARRRGAPHAPMGNPPDPTTPAPGAEDAAPRELPERLETDGVDRHKAKQLIKKRQNTIGR